MIWSVLALSAAGCYGQGGPSTTTPDEAAEMMEETMSRWLREALGDEVVWTSETLRDVCFPSNREKRLVTLFLETADNVTVEATLLEYLTGELGGTIVVGGGPGSTVVEITGTRYVLGGREGHVRLLGITARC